MNRFPALLLLTMGVLVGLSAESADAATISVNSTNLAVVQSDGQCTLIEAMENARNADGGYPDCAAGAAGSNVIELQVSMTYTLTGAWTNAGNPAALGLPIVTRPLTINGHGSTITRGAGSFRVFYVYATSLIINDLTVSNFVLPDGADGAIFNDNGALTINSSTLKGTRAAAGGTGGGAITSRACSPVVLPSCTSNQQASLTIADSIFDDNESRSTSSAFGAGAGVNTYAVGSGATNTTTIVRSRFHANTATNQGAGVSNAAYDSGATSTTAIDRSSVTGNTTTGGTTPAFGGGLTNFVGKVYTGAAVNTAAVLNITNSTIASNTAGTGYGGGVFNEIDCGFMVSCGGGASANLTLTSVTMYGNSAGPDQGAGIWSNNNEPGGLVGLDVRDLLIAGNLANGATSNCHLLQTTLTPAGYNIASDTTCGVAFNVFSEVQINLAPLNFTGLTYYQAPQNGSTAIDKSTCNVATDQIGTARPIGASCDVGAIESSAAAAPHRTNSDFNGDGRSDAGIFRPSVVPNALWYSTPSGGGAAFQIYFGMAGDIPVPADYDGDTLADAVIWRPSTGLWYGVRTGTGTIITQFILGQTGDIPVPCDYDGDGAVDPAFYRPSTGLWFGTRANGVTVVLNTNIGAAAGDIPIPADYNGDGRCDVGIMRPGVGPGGTDLWYSVPSGGGAAFQIYFGATGDVPAPGDYDGDGKADAVIFRPATGLWYGPRTGFAQIVIQILLGQNGDIPIPGDFDGNGAMDPAIYRPGTGLFFGTNAAGNTVVLNTNLGQVAGDIATGQRPHDQAFYPFFTTPSQTGNRAGGSGSVAKSLAPSKIGEATTGSVGEVVTGPSGSILFGEADQPLTITAWVPNGAADIGALYTLINSTLDFADGCLVAYDAATNTLQLADDTGTGWSFPIEVGSDDTIANSQCTIQAAGSSVLVDPDALTLVISVTFDPGFAGPKTIFGRVRDVDDGISEWESLGSWNIEPRILFR